MDLSLLKTFLEVYRTRHFGSAAENLHLSQSAISARIKHLEDLLGTPLFTRVRNGIQLTAAGERFLPHAEVMLTAWSRARQDLVAAQDSSPSLAVGGVYSLWDILLDDWINRVSRQHSTLALMLEAQNQETLVRKLIDEVLDVCFMFEAPQLTGVIEKEIAAVKLILVSTDRHADLQQVFDNHYVYVDWGLTFSHEHARCFPDMPYPTLRVSHGHLAQAFISGSGGSAYLAESSVREALRANRLYRVDNAPVIVRKAYAVYSADNEKTALIENVLALI